MASARTTPETRRVGDYVVGERIAVGGMAEVFLATKVSDGSPRVLKVLLPRCARDEATVKGLAHEAELARLLVHPGIVRAYELVTDEDVTALVLELVDGPALDGLLDHPGALDAPLAIHVATCLLEALDFVHRAKDADGRSLEVVHRDVSPHNVLLSRQGDVKLVDFGIARSALRDQRTRTGLVKGKLQYLSPEQATGSDVDARTDVYAVGLVLYEMLAGRVFLTGDSEIELLRAAETPTYAPIGREGVDPRLDGVLRKALARFPEERFASAKAFAAALAPFAPATERGRAALAELVTARSVALSPPRPATAAATPSASRMRVWMMVPVLAVALVAFYATRARAPEHVVPPRAIAAPVRDAPFVALDAAAVTPTQEEIVPTMDPPRAVRDGGRREVVVAPPPTPPEIVREPARTIAPAVLARRDRLLGAIEARGLTRADLGNDAPRLFAELTEAVALADDARAETTLARLEAMLAAVHIDAALVRRKMARVDARIADARSRGEDTRAVEALSRSALEAFVEGRYDAADAQLVRIERALSREP